MAVPGDRPLLVVTGLWPTPDLPSCGVFVQRRLHGVRATVIAPRSYHGPMVLRYAALFWRALAARGRFAGVEAHVLFPAGLIGLFAARIRRIPLVVYAHGSDVRETARENALYTWLASLVARRADAVVTNSESTAALIRDLGRDPTVIPPGVDRVRFRPTPRPLVRRILYLGGAEHHKGPEIAAGLADTMAGPGIRTVDPGEVPALMGEHDVVLVPSLAEPFGLVAAEAIAAGRWVVASNVDGLPEIVRDGVNGTLVNDGDYTGAVAAVPDYDPVAISRTVEWLDWRHHRAKMLELWTTVTSRG